MDEVSTSETSINFYESIRDNIPEDSPFRLKKLPNPKIHINSDLCLQGLMLPITFLSTETPNKVRH
jgi:hypothetical protein